MARSGLVPWRWESPLSLWREERPLQRLMSELFEPTELGRPFLGTGDGFDFVPRIDVTENDKEYRVTAELPGVKEKDIDLSVTGNLLTIKGEKRSEKEEESAGFYRHERVFGSFSRTIPFPVEVDLERVTAKFNEGVLNVSVPKTMEAQKHSKKIQIKQ